MPIEPTYYFVGQFSTFSYFFYFLFLIPFSYKIDFFFLENRMPETFYLMKARVSDI
jgi:hypothetical protein